MASNVIDSNIIVVANDPNHTSGEDCHATCRRFLYDFTQNPKRISMDSNELIFKEYLTYANLKGQPGIGDLFLKWLHDKRGFEDVFEQVDTDNIELPTAFSSFDPSDHKFLKVALGSQFKPTTIHNATDSDWLFFEQPEHSAYLQAHEVTINQLCLDCLKPI